MFPLKPLSSYTVNVDSNPLLAKVFNTPSIVNPLNGRIINAINDPYNPYLTVNSNITPYFNPTGYPLGYPTIIHNDTDNSGNRFYQPLSAIYPRQLYTPMIDVNNDPNLRNQMTKYFYEEFVYWLAMNDRYKKILTLLTVKDGKVINMNDNENKPEHIELKIKYIISQIDDSDMYELIGKFCKENRVNWWDLKKEGIKGPLKNYIYSYIKSYFKKKISRQ